MVFKTKLSFLYAYNSFNMYFKKSCFQKTEKKKRMKTAQRLKVISIILPVCPQGISNPDNTNFSLRNQTLDTNGYMTWNYMQQN